MCEVSRKRLDEIIRLVAKRAWTPDTFEPSDRELDGARIAIATTMRELAKEFRQIGDKLNDDWTGNDPYRSGLVQGAYDADGRLHKWANEVERGNEGSPGL